MEQVNIKNNAANMNRPDNLFIKIVKDYQVNKVIIWMTIPLLLWYIIFCYIPMYGIIISFKDFSFSKGIMDSTWVGLKHFRAFFESYYAWRVIRNTLLISIYQLIFGFPAPIILALLLNELRISVFKRLVQSLTYLPHFISMVVICGMIVDFTAQDGLINHIIVQLHGNPVSFLLQPEWFRPIYISSEIWQGIGWGSIIYLAALSGIDSQQYEAAIIDGANRWKQFVYVTLPGIMPTIVILLILQIGSFMSQGAEKIILLYNPATYETADTISSFVYRRGITEASYSFSAAVGLFNSSVNVLLLVTANWISGKVNETTMW